METTSSLTTDEEGSTRISPKLLSPDPEHAPERYQDAEHIRNDELIKNKIQPQFCGTAAGVSELAIFLVEILKYFWRYQNPKVLIVDVIACDSPRYVFCRKLKENLSFWQIDTSVPVVLSPWNITLDINLPTENNKTHIGKKEE